jgi:hypothetical protein
MEVSTSDISPPAKARKPSPLSYKFQRLREKIRAAINSGELTGKLPGERELAKRFHCNAKTLSKALTDLAAEGVLDRQIGRGTYVKGTREVESQRRGPWLILCNDAQASSPIIAELRRVNPDARISTDEPSLRPSFVTQFTGFVDFTGNAPADFLRDTIVRNIPLVLVGHEPKTYSTHAVIIDQTLGASNLCRDMLLAGHRRLLAVEERGETTLANAMRQTAARYATDATVDPCFAEEVPAAIEYGATAVLCASDDLAQAVFASLARSSRPADGVAVAAVGYAGDEPRCTGYFVGTSEMVDAITRLLQLQQTYRPTILWLTPTYIDRGTLVARDMPHAQTESAAASMRLAAGGSQA